MSRDHWKCKCGTINELSEPICLSCQKRKPSFPQGQLLIIGIGCVVFLVIVIGLILYMKDLPKEKFKETILNAWKDGVITTEEIEQIKKSQQQWSISNETADIAIQEIRDTLGEHNFRSLLMTIVGKEIENTLQQPSPSPSPSTEIVKKQPAQQPQDTIPQPKGIANEEKPTNTEPVTSSTETEPDQSDSERKQNATDVIKKYMGQ
ncbi:MAG: hypothetical protein HQK77_18155 [Desulfobacterales bacterium]|nr:hypothetical protein [Desulfobacterales bacterium]